MNRLRNLCVLLAVGCGGPASFHTDATDDPPGTDTDTQTPSACAGAQALSFAGIPEGPLTSGGTWKVDGVAWAVTDVDGARFTARIDDQGCFELKAATLDIDIVETGCAGSKAHVTLAVRCGPSCTTMEVYDAERATSYQANSAPHAEQSYTLAPQDAFGRLRVASLDATLCGISFDRVEVPPSLRPDDTAAPF